MHSWISFPCGFIHMFLVLHSVKRKGWKIVIIRLSDRDRKFNFPNWWGTIFNSLISFHIFFSSHIHISFSIKLLVEAALLLTNVCKNTNMVLNASHLNCTNKHTASRYSRDSHRHHFSLCKYTKMPRGNELANLSSIVSNYQYYWWLFDLDKSVDENFVWKNLQWGFPLLQTPRQCSCSRCNVTAVHKINKKYQYLLVSRNWSKVSTMAQWLVYWTIAFQLGPTSPYGS